MKKTIAILLSLCLCIGLCACSKSSEFNFSSVNVGDTITFGHYEQNNIRDDGKEPIEWLVLTKKDGKMLVISKYIIDIYPYHSSEIEITWEDCALRAWLNSSFYEDAFSIDERKIIVNTEVFTKGVHQKFYFDLLEKYMLTDEPMKDCTTLDKLFIPSLDELESYFNDESATIAKPTTYAKLAVRGEEYSAYDWFTRTPGKVVGAQKTVNADGSSLTAGCWNTAALGVRPCMWIEIGN